MPCSRSPGRGWYPSMPCRFPGPHPRGKLGLARGVSRPTPRGSPGPHLGECLLWEGSPGPHLGEGLLWEGSPGPHRGVPAPGGSASGGCGDPPMAIAAGGTHPTGMHSCYKKYCNIVTRTTKVVCFIKHQIIF